jgi:hypothetical protein
MKNLWLVALLILFACACAPTKYHYYFDHVQTPNQKLSPETISASSSSVAIDSVVFLSARSAEDVPVNFPSTQSALLLKSKKSFHSVPGVKRRADVTQAKSLKENTDPEPAGREGAAKAGFMLSLIAVISVPLIVAAAEFFAPVALLCTLLGFGLSIRGLRSSKRKLALAGLIMSSVLMLFVLWGVAVIIAWAV